MLSLSTAARNAKLDALTAFLGPAPLLRIFSGAPPGSANSPLTIQVQLAELVMNGTPFAPAVNGTVTANAITPDSSADASGLASFYRVYLADGVTSAVQGTVGLANSDLILNTTSIIALGPVAVASLVWTEGSP